MTRTVVLLHGLGRTRFSMMTLARQLKRRGYPVINHGYASRHQSIDTQVEILRERLKAEAAQGSELSFVTHSLGSIILRKFANLYHEEFTLHRAVMLGPPNQGAQLARTISKSRLLRWIMGPALDELRLVDLPAATDKLEIGIIAGGRGAERGIAPFITGDNDGIVAVEETRLAGAKAHMVLPGLHSFLMYQPLVVQEIIHFLEQGRFSK